VSRMRCEHVDAAVSGMIEDELASKTIHNAVNSRADASWKRVEPSREGSFSLPAGLSRGTRSPWRRSSRL
jgi:hypothetical protein